MAKLILIRGNSGSGKTCLAQALQEKYGANTLLLSHDMLRMKLLRVKGKEGIEKSLPLMIDLVKYGRTHCAITILEGILRTDEYAPLFDTIKAEYGKDVFAYYYDIPFEETLRRHQTKPNHGDFGEAELRRWWRDNDRLTLIKETIFDQDTSLEDAVRIITADIAR